MKNLTNTASATPGATARLDRLLVLLWAGSAAAGTALLALTAALGATLYGLPVVVALLLGALLGGSLLLALVAPVVGVTTSTGAVLALAVLSDPSTGSPWPVAVPTTVAFALTLALVALRSSWRPAFIAWVVGVAGASVVGILTHRPPVTAEAATADLIVFAAVTGVALGAAVLTARWQDVRAQLVREQRLTAAEHARREVAEERTRIARELHDVVAHGMSAIQVQASSARYRLPELSDEAAAEFDELAATARSALGEMRLLLGVLRHEEAAETAPQPGIGDLPELVARAGRRDDVRLEDALAADDAARGDAVLGLAAYRIVQEALSNIARHATGATAVVRLAREHDGLVLEVVNERAPGRPASAPAPVGGGHGLRGMRERAELLGGSLEAGPQRDGFRVRAVLPVRGTEQA